MLLLKITFDQLRQLMRDYTYASSAPGDDMKLYTSDTDLDVDGDKLGIGELILSRDTFSYVELDENFLTVYPKGHEKKGGWTFNCLKPFDAENEIHPRALTL